MTQLKDSMSNIEKIRQEIERRKKVYLTKNGFPKGTFGAIKIETYEGLLAFIDSLPEEEPSKDLNLDKEYNDFVESDPVYSKLVNNIVGKAIARHFAEWGAKHLK